MPGFGNSLFGRFAFGEFPWSEQVLFKNIPELYLQEDEGEVGDGALRDFIDSIKPGFEVLRHTMRSFGDLRDPFHVITQYDGTAAFRLGKQIQPLDELEQIGVDGVITPSRAFTAATARFRAEDRGKRIVIRGSSIPGNNRSFLIGAVVDTTTVILDPLASVDAGPLRWQVRALAESQQGIVTLEVQEGDVGLVTLGWVLNDGRADYQVAGRRRLPVPTTERRPLTEQEGLDGSINTQGRFSSAAAIFSKRNVGQILSLDGTFDLGNKTYARIARIEGTAAPQVVHLSDVSTGVAIALAPETGPFQWALYPRSQIDFRFNGPPVGVVEQDGTDLNILSSVGDTITFTSPSATFDPTRDIGKILRFVSFTNPTNNRLLTITAIASTTNGTAKILSPSFPATGSLVLELGVFWELRAPTGLGDTVQLEAHPVSILQYLATDFGIQIDSQESEDIQRSWVKNVTSWLDLKGTEKGYEIIGQVSGFIITAEALYRITQDLRPTIPDAYEVELRDYNTETRTGNDGSFLQVDGTFRFFSNSANFSDDDITRGLEVVGSTVLSNDATYVIASVIDSHTVQISSPLPTLPEASNGGLKWRYTRSRFGQGPDIPIPAASSPANGSFVLIAGEVYFTSLTAIFRASDIGNQIRIVGAADPANNRYYTIASVFSPTLAKVRSIDAPSLPDANSGSLEWYIVRLYTTLAPLLPCYDEINGDALAFWLATNPPTGDFFAADTFCWESGFSTQVAINITGVVNVIPNRKWLVTFTGPGEVVADVGQWYFVDSAGTTFYLESNPIEFPPGSWNTTVQSLNAPATLPSAATLAYRCFSKLICEYCGASKILATIVAGSALSLSALALERYRERILMRLRDVTPAHVELIPRFQTIIEAPFSLSATIEAGLVSMSMLAPFTALYDDIPADVYGAPAFDGVTMFYTDLAILVTVTTP